MSTWHIAIDRVCVLAVVGELHLLGFDVLGEYAHQRLNHLVTTWEGGRSSSNINACSSIDSMSPTIQELNVMFLRSNFHRCQEFHFKRVDSNGRENCG